MWTVNVNGGWHPAQSEEQIREWLRQGHVGPQTLVKHATWPAPVPLAHVPAFAGMFPGGAGPASASAPQVPGYGPPSPGQPPQGYGPPPSQGYAASGYGPPGYPPPQPPPTAKWFHHPAVIALSCLFCAPVGLAFLWTSKVSQMAKIAGSVAVAALFVIGVVAPRSEQSSAGSGVSATNRSAGQATQPTQPATPAPAARPQPSAISVTNQKLWNDYEANEVSADNAYKGKRLRVTGTVASITKDFMDDIVIHLASPNEFMNTMATMAKSESATAAGMRKGNKVTVLCEGNGRIIGTPALGDCTFQ